MTWPTVSVAGKRNFLSKGRFKSFANCAQREPTDRSYLGFKPDGLWYSVDDEWIEWCRSSMGAWLTESKFLYEIVLDEREVLCLRTHDAVLAFSEEYRSRRPNMPRMFCQMDIDWKRVAEKYAGIEIAPYQWGLRLDVRLAWYYPWDVASGCIWHERAVKSVTLLEERK